MFSPAPIYFLLADEGKFESVLLLLKDEGYSINIFNETQAFLHSLNACEAAQFMLLDENLISKDPFFFNKIKEFEQHHHIPLLLLVYQEEDLNSYKLLSDFILDIILMPISPLELISRLKIALQLRERFFTLRESQRELELMLGQKSQELKKIQEASQLADKLKNEMFSNISHEFRTPLTHILGYARLLLYDKGNIDSDLMEGLNIILNSAEKLSELINDVMDFSKIESGEFKLENRPFAIKDFLFTIEELMQRTLQEKEKILQFEVRQSIHLPEYLVADVSKLFQIMKNILMNAVKFTETGKIVLRIGKAKQQLTLEVIDTGIGMQAKDLSHIENDFVQVDASATRKYEGLGIGLAICRKLVNVMQGKMHIESELGKGTTVLLSIPYIEATQKEPEDGFFHPDYIQDDGDYKQTSKFL